MSNFNRITEYVNMNLGIIMAKLSGAGWLIAFLSTNMPILQATSFIIASIAGLTAIMVNTRNFFKDEKTRINKRS